MPMWGPWPRLLLPWLASPAPAGALLSCWEGVYLNYAICCQYPPEDLYRSNVVCWNDPSDQAGLYTFDRCCDMKYGPKIRFLPAKWTPVLNLYYVLLTDQGGFGTEISLQQDNARLMEENTTLGGPPDYGVLWEDHAARVLLSSNLLRLVLEDIGPPLRLLDLASGLGITPIAARKTGRIQLAVGVDLSRRMIARARRNARTNGVQHAHFVRFDLCRSASALRSVLHQHDLGESLTFHIFTMSGFANDPSTVMSCAYELIYGMASSVFVYVDSDSKRHHSGSDLMPFPDFVKSKGGEGCDPGRIALDQLLGTDERVQSVDVYMCTK